MKRFLLSGLVLLAIGATSAFAQNKNTFQDDIYYTSSQAQEEAKAAQKKQDAEKKQQQESGDADYYTSSGSGDEGQYSEDYIDYDDDYYYASQINRFSNPYYNRSYFSSFYNPNWYDPYWVDPYWGYNPWARPGFSVSIGYGPMWTSYWGWQTWCGYGSFNSYYNYPYWATGYGSYWGYGAGYYNGYWNGYYAGLYNGYGRYGNGFRTASYGPRYSLNSVRNGYIRGNGAGFRSAPVSGGTATGGSATTGPRRGFRTAGNENMGDIRNSASGSRINDNFHGSSPMTTPRDPRAGETRSFGDRNTVTGNAEPVREDRRRFEQPRQFDQSRTPVADAPRQERSRFSGQGPAFNTRPAEPRMQSSPTFEQPRAVQQPRMEQPRYNQPAAQPRMETAPRYESPRSGSFGGGNSGGGGRSGFGGRR